MNDSLRPRFEQSEVSFISAVSSGPASVEAFYETWSDLQHDFLEAMKNNVVDEETCSVAHLVAMRIELIASLFMESTTIADALTASFAAELESLFARLSINHESTSPSCETELGSPIYDKLPVFKAPHGQLPAYIEPAYGWLLNNLHNPYPSKEVKSRFALASNKSMKDIDNWFISVRKRIGWNTIRKECFSGKQVEIVEAARVYFDKPTDTDKQPTNISSTLSIEFAAMEAKAISLYSRPFSPTRPNTSTMSMEESRPTSVDRAALAYPSPDHSPASSPEPEAPSDFFPISPCRKRRFSSSDCSEFSPDEKRRRVSRPSSPFVLPSTNLPSPAPSPLITPRIMLNQSTTPSAITLDQKRKRRLSVSEDQVQAKRSRVEQLGEISYPLSSATGPIDLSTNDHLLTTSLEELLSTTEIPPVSACTPNDFAFSDIEYFQLDFPVPPSVDLPSTPVSPGSVPWLDLEFSYDFQKDLAFTRPIVPLNHGLQDHGDLFGAPLPTDFFFPLHSLGGLSQHTRILPEFDWSSHLGTHESRPVLQLADSC